MSYSKVALIDGDIIVYKVAYEKSQEEQGSKNDTFSSENVASSAEGQQERTWDQVRQSIDDFMLHICNETGTTHYVGYLSPTRAENFRTILSVSEKYKGNRDNREIPRYFNEIKEYLIGRWKFHQLICMETDDALAVLQTFYAENEDVQTTICSIDKDMKQIKGRHWNWKTNDFVEVTHEDAYKFLWSQVLTGDTTDNIMGCGERIEKVYKSGEKKGQSYLAREGVGPVGAEKIINEVSNIEVLPHRVLIEFIDRFGLHKGVNKYHEAFNLIFLLRDWHPNEPIQTTVYTWTKPVEEDEETTF